MPIRMNKVLDEEGNVVIDQDTGEPVLEPENFPTHFLGNSDEEAEQCLTKYERDVKLLASKFTMLTGADQEDLFQEGLIGLARAKRDFEESRSSSFRIFAIYKIKDSMKEFVTKQNRNIKVPQYIVSTNRLTDELRDTLKKGVDIEPFLSNMDVWNFSFEYEGDQEIKREVAAIRERIENMALRSATTVPQLLERAEIMPSFTFDVEDYNLVDTDTGDVESDLLDKLDAENLVKIIKDIIEPEEFELLYKRFVEGKTIRELEPEYGIRAASIVTKTNKILHKLQRSNKLKGVMTNEFSCEGVEEPGQGSEH